MLFLPCFTFVAISTIFHIVLFFVVVLVDAMETEF